MFDQLAIFDYKQYLLSLVIFSLVMGNPLTIPSIFGMMLLTIGGMFLEYHWFPENFER